MHNKWRPLSTIESTSIIESTIQHWKKVNINTVINTGVDPHELNTLVHSRHSGRNGGGRWRSAEVGGCRKSAEVGGSRRKVESRWRSVEVGGGRKSVEVGGSRRRSADVGSRRRSVEVGGGRRRSVEVGGSRRRSEVGGNRRKSVEVGGRRKSVEVDVWNNCGVVRRSLARMELRVSPRWKFHAWYQSFEIFKICYVQSVSSLYVKSDLKHSVQC